MDLILWRHAEAEDGYPDADRCLTAKGINDAQRMGQWLKHAITEPIRVVVSPAKRTCQTAMAYRPDFEISPEIGTDSRPERILSLIGWPDPQQSVLVVGHQPTLGETAAFLMTGETAPWSIQKGAVWWFRGRIREGQPQIVLRAVIHPRDL